MQTNQHHFRWLDKNLERFNTTESTTRIHKRTEGIGMSFKWTIAHIMSQLKQIILIRSIY